MLKLTYAQVKAAIESGFVSPLNTVKQVSKVFVNKFTRNNEGVSVHEKVAANVGIFIWKNYPNGFAKAVMLWKFNTAKGVVSPFPRKRNFI